MDTKRQEALNSLASDSGLYQLLSQLCSYITEGIKINISQRKLAILKHLLKMAKSLLDNPSLSLEKYLHELIPAVSTCLINKQVCLRPEAEDHWSLRESAAKILGDICKKYSNSVNGIQSRITRVLSQAVNNNTQGLAVHYGAVAGFVALDAVASLVIPRLKQEGDLIRAVQTSRVVEHVAATRLQALLVRHCAPILMSTRPATDTLQQFQEAYGYLGTVLFNQVKTLRQNRAGLSQLPQQTIVRLQSPTLKSPTTPVSITLGQARTNRPPPLSIPSSTQFTLVKGSANGTPKTQTPISSLSSPTIAAALRLIGSPSSGTPTLLSPASIPVTLLSAVMNNPAMLASLANSGQQQETKTQTVATTSTPATSSSS